MNCTLLYFPIAGATAAAATDAVAESALVPVRPRRAQAGTGNISPARRSGAAGAQIPAVDDERGAPALPPSPDAGGTRFLNNSLTVIKAVVELLLLVQKWRSAKNCNCECV